MTRVEKIIFDFRKTHDKVREDIKKEVRGLLRKGQITYAEALTIFEESRLFNIQPHCGDIPEIADLYLDQTEDWLEKGRTVKFTGVLYWVNENEAEFRNAWSQQYGGKEYNPDEDIYNYVVKTDCIGFVKDW